MKTIVEAAIRQGFDHETRDSPNIAAIPEAVHHSIDIVFRYFHIVIAEKNEFGPGASNSEVSLKTNMRRRMKNADGEIGKEISQCTLDQGFVAGIDDNRFPDGVRLHVKGLKEAEEAIQSVARRNYNADVHPTRHS